MSAVSSFGVRGAGRFQRAGAGLGMGGGRLGGGYGPGAGARFGPGLGGGYGPGGPGPLGGPGVGADRCGLWSSNCGQCNVPASRYYVTQAAVPPALGFVARPITYPLCATLFPFKEEFYYIQPKSCYSNCCRSESSECDDVCDKRDKHSRRSRFSDCGSDRCCRRPRRHKSDRDCCTDRQGYGSAKISLTIDRCTNTAFVSGRIDYYKLSSSVVGVQIRGPSDPYRHDLCGPVAIDVGALYATSATCDLNNYTTFNATIACQEAENILLGRYFIQVNTCEYRNGELKGRIVGGSDACC